MTPQGVGVVTVQLDELLGSLSQVHHSTVSGDRCVGGHCETRGGMDTKHWVTGNMYLL